MVNYNELTSHELKDIINNQEITSEEVIHTIFERIDKVEPKIHAYVSLFRESALKNAKIIDDRIKKGETIGRLGGIPIAVKDVICTKGKPTTCGSRILENYIPPFDATVIERIKKEDAIIIGKTNMDEFAMGSSTENSAFGYSRNPWALDRVTGGSSGGSAAAIAADETIIALGSDTGGSIRCPASFCSVIGLKPTYGLVSRYGLVAYANSLEQIGPITKDVTDCALLLSIINGNDYYDSTSVPFQNKDYMNALIDDVKGFTLGVPREFFGEGTEKAVEKCVWTAIHKFEDLGAKYSEISMPHIIYSIPTYYIIAMSEASSNLARFDGMRYGFRAEKTDADWNEIFEITRQKGFGPEVKRRIILGSFALSAGYYDKYYLKALKIRTLIKKDFETALANHSALIAPTMPTPPFKIGEKIENPLNMYMSDIDTVPINLAGVPSISIPCGFVNGLPVGMQIIGRFFDEETILRIAYTYEQNTSFNKEKPTL
ncbi:MAG: Asp-tRNA(Asn)/Glu-tRNA(Gln) amidotransferase subunit GatA [Candidatus Jordarchaeum sp.]|uniref:Asp-tRNA(Asn)/Glu-tRNA(Gln) amidotransferase subunit GatA n=1 Tax=Candidatus Jordarchaeum sp. TaxID=2823881 RepID=UPI00404B9924